MFYKSNGAEFGCYQTGGGGSESEVLGESGKALHQEHLSSSRWRYSQGVLEQLALARFRWYLQGLSCGF